jgi:hypothetical protein
MSPSWTFSRLYAPKWAEPQGGATGKKTMEYYTLLIFGLLVGMQHALEADHLAAVAAMSARRTSRRALVLRGSFWGLGHTAALLSICGVLLIWGGTISARTEALLELSVGAMIVFLGGNVIRKLWRQRPHFHVHHHEDATRHVHAHVHAGEAQAHEKSVHRHEHRELGFGRAVLVGMMHGAAGSAGLLVLAAAADSLATATGYVIAFGVGSIAGMAALSFVASYPLGFLERSASWISTAAHAAIGGVAIFIGGQLLVESWAGLL